MIRPIAICLLLCVVHGALAKEPIRWKFAVGDTMRLETEQVLDCQVASGEGDAVLTKTEQHKTIRFEVEEVTPDGDARMTQTIERIEFHASSPGNVDTHYDSASQESAEGIGAMVAPLLNAMVGAKIEIRMSRRGEVSDVKLDPSLEEKFKNNPLAKIGGAMFSEAGLKRVCEQTTVLLPEAFPKEGQSWTAQQVVDSPAGVQIVRETYQYVGERSQADRPVQIFETRLDLAMDPAGREPPIEGVEFADQESVGETLFDAAAGLPVSVTRDQEFTMKLRVDGRDVVNHVKQKMSSFWSRVDPKPTAESPAGEAGRAEASR